MELPRVQDHAVSAMKVGDRVRMTGLPPGLQDKGMGTKKLFELCRGRVFPIIDFDDYGLLELHVGEVVGEPDYMHSIWIEPEFVEVVETSS